MGSRLDGSRPEPALGKVDSVRSTLAPEGPPEGATGGPVKTPVLTMALPGVGAQRGGGVPAAEAGGRRDWMAASRGAGEAQSSVVPVMTCQPRIDGAAVAG